MKLLAYLIIMLPTSLLAQTFSAKSPNDNNTYVYSVNSDGETVSIPFLNYKNVKKYEKFKTIDLPSEVYCADKKYKVTAIKSNVFLLCKKVKTIKLPDGIESVGDGCFYGCGNLEEVYLPSSLQNLSRHMFQYCSALKNVFIKGNLKTIGGSAFEGCRNLSSIVIPSTVRHIGKRAFYDCTSNIRFIIDGSNEYYKVIDGVLFSFSGDTLIAYPAANLRKEYMIPEGVEVIQEGAFSSACNLEKIYFPNSLKKIEEYGFYKCSNIVEIALGNQLDSIGIHAFYFCKRLKTVTMNKKTSFSENIMVPSFPPDIQINKLDNVALTDFGRNNLSTAFIVRDFMMVSNDISARVNEVKDSNNDPCALIKLQVDDDLLSIEGNLVKLDNQESPEKWVYVTEGTKLIKLVFKNHLPITLSVTDYGLEELKGKSTYVLRIE